MGLIILCVYFACTGTATSSSGTGREAGILPVFMDSHDLLFRVAGAVMFWSIIEPLWDIVQPPQYAAPMTRSL